MLLSEGERLRAAQFHFEQHKRQFMAAHALKRMMLCESAGGIPHDWAFTSEPNGKPRVDGRHGPHFNISHCRGLVACGVSMDVQLGIDVEWMEHDAPLDLAERYFAAGERSWLCGLPEPERARGFYRVWTMKEAFIKATGKGLSQDLHSFEVEVDALRVGFLDPARAEPGPWQFAQRMIGADHVLSLAWRGPPAILRWGTVQLEEIAAR